MKVGFTFKVDGEGSCGSVRERGSLGNGGLGNAAQSCPQPNIAAAPPLSIAGLWVYPAVRQFFSLNMTILSLTWTELGTAISFPGAMPTT